MTQGDPDKSHPNYQQLYFGYGAASSVKERRIFMHLSELPSIPDGSVVTDAQISLYLQDYSYVTCQSIGAAIYEVTEDKPENRTYQSWINYMTWNTQAAYDTTNMIDYVVLQEGNGGLKDWNITELVKKWYAEGTENRTMAMAITPGARAYSSTYCAVPVFLGYASQSYPVITVTYQNNVGIEDYYTYATLGGGEAGSAYLADATGQLTAVKGLVSYASSINPFSLSLVYNSNYFAKNAAKVYYPTEELGLSMRLGIGWSLDVIQKVEPVIIDEVQYVKYTDGDGTVHYFSENTDEETESESEAETETETTEIVYYDEDGLGLQIVVNTDGTYTMSDIQDNIYTFTNGFLTNIKDNNNNQYLINYSNGKLTSIVQQNNNCTAITVATFAYSGDYLATVTDAAGIVHTIGYSSNHISSISNGSTTIATYNYSDNRLISMTEATSGYTLRYTYTTDGKIGHYEEYTTSGGTGAQVDVYYNGLDKTTYRDYGNDRIKNTEDDILTYYLFDYAGRTVNAYSTDAVGNVLGASNAVYTGTGSTDKRNNRTLRTASIGVSAEQELLNSGFENSNSSYQWTLAGTITRSTDNPRTGAHSLKGVMTNNSNSVTATKASQKLYARQTYTLSAYVNTVNVEFDYLDGITLTVSDGTNSWESYNMYHKTTETVDDGWTLISVTFTAKITGVHTVGVTASDGTGTFYVDDFQLEKGEGPSNYNLIENGNFQAEGFSWTLGSTGEYKSSNGMHRDNGEAIAPVITSTPLNGNAKISQTVTVNLPGTETYVLSGWGSANAVPDNVDTAADWAQDTTKTFGLRAILTYSDGTTEYHYAPFNADVTDWQFTSLTIIPNEPTKTVATITVVCVYEKNGNSASFDNISLVRQVAQSMTYDEDGNLTSASSTGVTTDTYTYEDGNLIESNTGTGSPNVYTYDSLFTHRLLSYTDGLTSKTMSYDDVGNVTSNTVSAIADTSMTIRSENNYSNNGNLLSSSTDTNGITTSYSYSSDINKMLALPSTIRMANGVATNIYYDNWGRTTSMSLANMALLEYYYASDGNLQEIMRTNSYGDSQSYHMTYDDFGNMTELWIGDYLLASYVYDPGNGPLMEQTYGNGAYVLYCYDNLGRIKEVCQYDSGWTEYFYNGEGQLHRVEDPSGTFYYTYNTTGQLIASEMRAPWGAMLMRVDLQYDAKGQLVGQKWNIDGTEYSESYTYNSADGSLNTMTTATGETLQMNYDALQRVSSISSSLYTKNYTYKSRTDGTTNLVTRIQYTDLPSTLNFNYAYDTEGNIATYRAPGKTTVRYIYDDAGQLVRTTGGQTNVYSYDEYGNLISVNEHTYTYGNEGWRDLLTAFDGEEITYDESGNPLSYFNGTRWTFTWQDGRRLASATDGITEISYAYDGEGLRTSKWVGDSYHEYFYAGGQLLRECYDGDVLDFFYDENCYPYALKYNDTTYYYITNLQGDVIYLIDEDGETVASYEYDPYGNILSATGEMAEINPLRYRGYYYDAELEMYYLQSRYYDPMMGRFINADDVALLGVSGTALGYNLFAYCENNPVNHVDMTGEWLARVVGGVAGAVLFGTLAHIICKIIGQFVPVSKQASATITAVAAALGGVIGAVLGPGFIAKHSSRFLKALNKLEKTKFSMKMIGPNTGGNLFGINISNTLIIMLHAPHPKYGEWYFHLQVDVNIGKQFTIFKQPLLYVNSNTWGQ